MGKILDEDLIYEILSVVEEIPAGKVASYGQIARTAPGWREQSELLEDEGVEFKANGCVDMKRYQWEE